MCIAKTKGTSCEHRATEGGCRNTSGEPPLGQSPRSEGRMTTLSQSDTQRAKAGGSRRCGHSQEVTRKNRETLVPCLLQAGAGWLQGRGGHEGGAQGRAHLPMVTALFSVSHGAWLTRERSLPGLVAFRDGKGFAGSTASICKPVPLPGLLALPRAHKAHWAPVSLCAPPTGWGSVKHRALLTVLGLAARARRGAG